MFGYKLDCVHSLNAEKRHFYFKLASIRDYYRVTDELMASHNAISKTDPILG